METDVAVTQLNFDDLLERFPPSPTSTEPIEMQSTLPLVLLLSLAGAASWRLGREVDQP